MNWLRYWFPSLGGRRQCVKCGFLSDEGNIIEGSSIAPRLTPQHKEVELSIRGGISFDAIGLPPIKNAACFRGIWGTVNDAMEAQLDDALGKYPTFPPILASGRLMWILRGDAASGIPYFEQAMRLPDPEGSGELSISGLRVFFAPWYVAALMETGQTAEALEVADAVIEEVERQQDWGARYVAGFSLHRVLAGLFALRGERERALAALRQAVADGSRSPWRWKTDPALASLRDDLGFITLVEEVEADVARQRARLEEQGLLLTPEQALTANL